MRGSPQTWQPQTGPGLEVFTDGEAYRSGQLTHGERFWEQRRVDRQWRREGRREKTGPEIKQPSTGSKMAAGEARTDGPFLMLCWGSREREKGKINTITVRNLKINGKT